MRIQPGLVCAIFPSSAGSRALLCSSEAFSFHACIDAFMIILAGVIALGSRCLRGTERGTAAAGGATSTAVAGGASPPMV